MTPPARLKRDLQQCDRQIAEYRQQLPLVAALLAARGIFDWQIERGMILRELPMTEWPDEWIGEKHAGRRGWPCRAWRTLGRHVPRQRISAGSHPARQGSA